MDSHWKAVLYCDVENFQCSTHRSIKSSGAKDDVATPTPIPPSAPGTGKRVSREDKCQPEDDRKRAGLGEKCRVPGYADCSERDNRGYQRQQYPCDNARSHRHER